jgi:hypothetical protein
MAKLGASDPQSANEYDDRTTTAVKSVLVEIGQILGSFQGKFAVIGGAVPWLLLDNHEMPHVGTLDVDLGLDAEALGDGEYALLAGALMKHDYKQSQDLRKFQLVRSIAPGDGGSPIDVIVDFLMPRDAIIDKNKPPILEHFAVQRADGADLAIRFNEKVAVVAAMPNGGTNKVEIAVCSIPALLAMKGYAIRGRYKQKDAYDIYYCVRNYPGGVPELAEACRPLLEHPSGAEGFGPLSEKFDTLEGYGPTCVRKFVEESRLLGDRTPEQWQQDAFWPGRCVAPGSWSEEVNIAVLTPTRFATT